MQQASTFIIGTYSHTITLLIQTYSLSIFQIDLPLQLFNQLFERFERRKRHNFQYTTIFGPTPFLTLVCLQLFYDSAGKFCPDIMLPSVIATEQKERENVWAVSRAQEP